MAEQRSSFRFRLPWTASRSARGSTTTIQSEAASQATAGSPAPLPENQNSSQSATAPTAGAAQRPPFRPAGIAPVQGSSSPTQASRGEPKPSSPSRSAPQSRPTTPSSSPSRKSPQSPSRLASRAAEETSSTSASETTAKMQPTPEEIAPQPSLPSKKLEDQSLLPTKPDNESQAPPKTEQQPAELQPKKDTTSEDTSKEAKIQQPEMSIQPSKESEKTTPATDITEGREAPEPSEKSDITTNNQESKPSVDSNLEEAKEVIQETGGKDNEEAKQEVKEIQTTTEQPAVAVQPEDKQEQFSMEQTVKTSNSNGQQTKTIVTGSHQKLGMSKEQPPPLHKDIKDSSISKLVQQTDIGGNKQSMEERPVNVITLAGDNRGASLQFGFGSSNNEKPVHIHRSYKSNPDESIEATTNAEESSGGRKLEDQKAIRNQEVKACVNCNIQGSNNSILLNSSVTERNPGVNLEMPHLPAEPVKSYDKKGSIEIRKAESNATHAQKLTYEPTIRRRCLKGLFLESSDSDLDNPEKPRRHGCRAYCKEKPIENEEDIKLSR
nr:flocculation protein FLO11 [Ipomoea batatas]